MKTLVSLAHLVVLLAVGMLIWMFEMDRGEA